MSLSPEEKEAIMAPVAPRPADTRARPSACATADDEDLLLDGQAEADLALDRARCALEDVALALHGHELARRHFSSVTREIGEGFLRLARAS